MSQFCNNNEWPWIGGGYVSRNGSLVKIEKTPDVILRWYIRDLDLLMANNSRYIEPLRGKDLVCDCQLDSLHCHADVLLERANK